MGTIGAGMDSSRRAPAGQCGGVAGENTGSLAAAQIPPRARRHGPVARGHADASLASTAAGDPERDATAIPEMTMTRSVLLALLAAMALAACNTVRGLGQDMSTAGRAASDTPEGA